MSDACDLPAARERLRRFLAPDCTDRLFVQPTGHPARDTGFCYCDGSLPGTLRVWIRGALLTTVLMLPCNGLKLRVLRWCGARIGRDVYLSEGVWIDPVFPHLLTIEDEVLIGFGARIFFHEFRRDEFRAGRVILRSGSFVGGLAVLGCGVEIGRNATVSAAAVVGKDVPEGHVAIGNPARILHGSSKDIDSATVAD
jgi:hypothetical protein